jgi:hypothetical protein
MRYNADRRSDPAPTDIHLSSFRASPRVHGYVNFSSAPRSLQRDPNALGTQMPKRFLMTAVVAPSVIVRKRRCGTVDEAIRGAKFTADNGAVAALNSDREGNPFLLGEAGPNPDSWAQSLPNQCGSKGRG